MLDSLNSLFQVLTPLWEMSVTAAYAAAIIIILRLLLKKRAPKQVLCLLWLVVFVRLLIPVSLESPLSIVPDARPVQEQFSLPRQEGVGQGSVNPAGPTQNPAQGQNPGTATNPVIGNPGPTDPTLTLPEGVSPNTPQPEAPTSFPWRALVAGVWLAGTSVMALYALYSYFRLRRRLFDAIRAKDGAWEHPDIDSPFILGIFRPRIYLPAGLVGRPRQFILCHERAHLRRLDHIVKPVCWIALALHWFNPLVWAAYLLMSRDIETACDESVIRRLGSDVKADYSTTLLALATGRRVPSPCPLAFDEGDAKGRIKNVLRYRRPALWVIVVSAVMAVAAAVCLLTDPVAAETPEGDPDPSPGVSTTQPPEKLADTLLDPWMKEVLDGERSFTPVRDYGDNSRTYTIHDLRTFYYGDDQDEGATVEAGRLAIIDLDRDGVNELVIWPEGDDKYLYSVVGFVILRRQGDEICAYNPVYRAFGNLKSDGTFDWSNSAFNWGTGSALFTENGYEVKDITWYELHDETDERYFVDGRKATREEFNAAYDFQAAKLEPDWYTYAGGVLSPWRPGNAEVVSQAGNGEAKLWLDDSEIPWLEWNGATAQMIRRFTKVQSPAIDCRDFDGDGENEVLVTYMFNGFPQFDLYEWNGGQVACADAFDGQNLLLRFNQNNVAAYNKDTRGLTATYSHTEGDPDSADYYRRLVTGSCTLPEGFFNGYEHIRDGYPHVYANQFQQFHVQAGTNALYLGLDIYLADETMQELTSVDILSGTPPYSWYAEHYMIGRPVGSAAFTLRYDGAKWVLREPDQLNMGVATPIEDITSAAPLSAPVTDLMGGLPNDPEEWYKVAELPDDMIWVFSRNYGAETLIRWDGNFYKTFNRTAHTARAIPPLLKKLGGADTYGPLAIISNVGSGTGVSLYELAVYDLDSSDAVSYVHDWRPLVDEFNAKRAYRYGKDTHTVICAYEQQMAELIIDGDDEVFRRIDEEGVSAWVAGEIVSYQFNDDGTIQVEFPIQAFIGDDVTDYPLIWPWFVRWTIRFNGSGFDTVPGSCQLFTYAGQ